MITSHTELGYEALKAQIMLLDFISKYSDWTKHFEETIEKAMAKVVSAKRQNLMELNIKAVELGFNYEG